jgi:hypothetical protein
VRKAEKVIRNFAQRLEPDWSGLRLDSGKASTRASPSRGLDCRRSCGSSLACTNIIENMMGTVRLVCSNVTLGLGLYGEALDRSRHAGSSQRLPTTEGPQATSSATCPWKRTRQGTQPAPCLLAKPM